MDEKGLSDHIEKLRELGQNNPEVDVAALAMTAMAGYQKNFLSDKEKRWGYLISLGLPPLGLIFAAKFYFSKKDDGLQAATICVVLTFVSILVTVVLFKSIFSTSGVTPQTLKQAPTDYLQLIQ